MNENTEGSTMLFVAFVVLLAVAAAIHVAVSRARARAVELFLIYLLTGFYGVAMLFGAFVHLTNGAALDAMKGWPDAGRPLHTLYAFALIGVALASLLTIRLRGHYVLGPAIAGAVLSFGGAVLHIDEMLEAGHFDAPRDGPEILLDVVVPLTVLALAIRYVTARRGESAGS